MFLGGKENAIKHGELKNKRYVGGGGIQLYKQLEKVIKR